MTLLWVAIICLHAAFTGALYWMWIQMKINKRASSLFETVGKRLDRLEEDWIERKYADLDRANKRSN